MTALLALSLLLPLASACAPAIHGAEEQPAIPVPPEASPTLISTKAETLTRAAPTPSILAPNGTADPSQITVAVVETGDFESSLVALQQVGLSGQLLPSSALGSSMEQYDIVFLPSGWADYVWYSHVESHAEDFLDYVRNGGGLFAEQPNPYQLEDNSVTPDLLPYPITFQYQYDVLDWPPSVVDPLHPITRGIPAEQMPGPADQVVSFDPAYSVLVKGAETSSPSLLVAEYGAGKVVLYLDNAYACPECRGLPFSPSPTVLAQAIAWLINDAP